ncbi:DUF2817 domain-containing protein [Botrimarina sp.]|uniref:DUF2817 domain-containing protein n=1 Tax=Botrimarina sp. TaxID=2795802 RepID=UPI0032EBD0D8
MASSGGDPSRFFPLAYQPSRDRLRRAAEAAGLSVHELPIGAAGPDGRPLAIDTVLCGDAARKAVVVSSGVHGVETPLGAAIQTAWLERLAGGELRPPTGCTLALVHAVNPYGFAWGRRFNEDNVDLNRNFLLDGEAYRGSAPMVEAFRSAFVGSRRLPGTSMPMALLAARHGRRAFWETLPPGQYDHRDWIFYGGSELSESGQRLKEWLPDALGAADEIVWLDFHTGLGRFGHGELLLPERAPADEIQWWRQAFPAAPIVAATSEHRYAVQGGFGPWLKAVLPGSRLHYATAEFGTYQGFRMLRALIEENGATRRDPTIGPDHPARKRLAAAFAPRSPRWQRQTFAQGMDWVQRAMDRLAG